MNMGILLIQVYNKGGDILFTILLLINLYISNAQVSISGILLICALSEPGSRFTS